MRSLLLLFVWLGNPLTSGAQDGFIEGSPRLAYWQAGKSNNFVIILHGGPGATHQYLRPEFDALTKTAQIVYYDQRGCGRSERASSYTWQDHVADLNRLIHKLAYNQRVFIVGSSWGSFLAILYAYSYPQNVKGLILTGTAAWTGEEGIYKRDTLIAKRAIRSQKGSIGETGLVGRETPNQAAQQDTISISKEIEITSGLPQYEPVLSMVSAPKAERLRQVKVPILLFNGTRSRVFDWASEYLKLFPAIQVRTIGDAGHDPWLRDPNLFFSISNQFVNDTID